MNTYIYANVNPLSFFDKDGLRPCPEGISKNCEKTCISLGKVKQACNEYGRRGGFFYYLDCQCKKKCPEPTKKCKPPIDLKGAARAAWLAWCLTEGKRPPPPPPEPKAPPPEIIGGKK